MSEELTDADKVMLKDGGAKGKPKSIYPDTELTDEEIGAIRFGGQKLKMPRIMPYFEVKEMRIKGKKTLVPFIGIQGTF